MKTMVITEVKQWVDNKQVWVKYKVWILETDDLRCQTLVEFPSGKKKWVSSSSLSSINRQKKQLIKIVTNNDLISHIEKNEFGTWIFDIDGIDVLYTGQYSKVSEEVKHYYSILKEASYGEVPLINFIPAGEKYEKCGDSKKE